MLSANILWHPAFVPTGQDSNLFPVSSSPRNTSKRHFVSLSHLKKHRLTRESSPRDGPRQTQDPQEGANILTGNFPSPAPRINGIFTYKNEGSIPSPTPNTFRCCQGSKKIDCAPGQLIQLQKSPDLIVKRPSFFSPLTSLPSPLPGSLPHRWGGNGRRANSRRCQKMRMHAALFLRLPSGRGPYSWTGLLGRKDIYLGACVQGTKETKQSSTL